MFLKLFKPSELALRIGELADDVDCWQFDGHIARHKTVELRIWVGITKTFFKVVNNQDMQICKLSWTDKKYLYGKFKRLQQEAVLTKIDRYQRLESIESKLEACEIKLTTIDRNVTYLALRYEKLQNNEDVLEWLQLNEEKLKK